MDTSLEWKIVVGQRRFTGNCTVGGEEEECNNHGRTKWLVSWEAETWKKIDIFGIGSGWMALGCIDPNNNNYFYVCIVHTAFNWLNSNQKHKLFNFECKADFCAI